MAFRMYAGFALKAQLQQACWERCARQRARTGGMLHGTICILLFSAVAAGVFWLAEKPQAGDAGISGKSKSEENLKALDPSISLAVPGSKVLAAGGTSGFPRQKMFQTEDQIHTQPTMESCKGKTG